MDKPIAHSKSHHFLIMWFNILMKLLWWVPFDQPTTSDHIVLLSNKDYDNSKHLSIYLSIYLVEFIFRIKKIFKERKSYNLCFFFFGVTKDLIKRLYQSYFYLFMAWKVERKRKGCAAKRSTWFCALRFVPAPTDDDSHDTSWFGDSCRKHL